MDAKDPGLTEHARALAARRRQIEGECIVCGRRFVGTSRRRYCSSSCSTTAYRQRTDRVVLPAQDPADLSPLVTRLDAVRRAISRGRVFEDSVIAIREGREERARAICPDP